MRDNPARLRISRYFRNEYAQLKDTFWRWRPLMKSQARLSVIAVFLAVFLFGAFFTTRLSFYCNNRFAQKSTKNETPFHVYPHKLPDIPEGSPPLIEFLLNCTASNRIGTCPGNYPTTVSLKDDPSRPSSTVCPDYFRWIHEDLRPWAHTGISRDMIERANRTANFRLVIMDGKAYVETYQKSFQSRDTFTLWGVLQLLRTYPGKLPDLEIMFDCVDWPVISSNKYTGPHSSTPPPLFRYCGDDATLDIVFPDWSYWGWPEINIKPWEALLSDLKEGNKKRSWVSREPVAYWKGNPAVAPTRQDLLKCNVSENQDWNARIYAQDWNRESQQGYKDSDLSSQCRHRYKIYIEGSAWSVSEKYILACDSVTLVVKPKYYDFFTRSLVPMQHYWPIKEDDKCKSIKFAVDWGNNNNNEAQDIGKKASKFVQEDLKMEFVYDYMFHLLSEYSKLLTFEPRIPENARELCSETMACQAEGLTRKFMEGSLVKSPSDKPPCTMPPPLDPPSLRAVIRTRENSIKKVEEMEKTFGENRSK